MVIKHSGIRMFFIGCFLMVFFSGSSVFASKKWHEYYEEAEKAIEEEQWETAISLLKKAIELGPEPGIRRKFGMWFVEYYPYLKEGQAYLAIGNQKEAYNSCKTAKEKGAAPKKEVDKCLQATKWVTDFVEDDRRGVIRFYNQQGEEAGWYEESHALVIGVSEYTSGWRSLPGVQEDVKAIGNVLKSHGFNVIIVENPKDRSALEKAFTEFINTYGQRPENRLLFYFAGHGATLTLATGIEMGYIVPVDAPRAHDAEFTAKALDMQMIEVYARRIQSKHALFVFDSCFSGSVFSLLPRGGNPAITYITANPVRQIITSGSANETVPDKSIFRKQFVAALTGDSDMNRDGYVTGTELGEFLYHTVTNYSKGTQHPQYGKIRDPLLDKGDFVFRLSDETRH